MRRFGFTLAEVLVTLGIIGVVAALTMPQMTVRTQNMQLETATLKYYSQIQEAVQRHLVQNGLDELDASFDGAKFVEDNFKTALTCRVATAEEREAANEIEDQEAKDAAIAALADSKDCFANQYKTLNGANNYLYTSMIATQSAYVLNGGASIQVQNGVNPRIFLDVNGVKGPNMLNRDMWQLRLSSDGSVVDVIQGTTPNEIETNLARCKEVDSNEGCFAGFVKNGFKFPY